MANERISEAETEGRGETWIAGILPAQPVMQMGKSVSQRVADSRIRSLAPSRLPGLLSFYDAGILERRRGLHLPVSIPSTGILCEWANQRVSELVGRRAADSLIR